MTFLSICMGIADNMITATRLVNNMMFANMEAFKSTIQQAKDNAKELSRVGVNSARTFEQTSRGAATRLGSDNTSNTTKVYVQREEEEQRDQRRI